MPSWCNRSHNVKAREKHTKAVKRRKEMARKAMERAGKKKKAISARLSGRHRKGTLTL